LAFFEKKAFGWQITPPDPQNQEKNEVPAGKKGILPIPTPFRAFRNRLLSQIRSNGPVWLIWDARFEIPRREGARPIGITLSGL